MTSLRIYVHLVFLLFLVLEWMTFFKAIEASAEEYMGELQGCIHKRWEEKLRLEEECRKEN
ncbi:hypothetical protein L484_024726 [Morus notabilis]|uniref:Uncharacterized protein n=1 Tax=Morus notabilis TaxID=981085 RepID=W9R4N8_9ROSA|nr:hypothetical protein L484_024726 [Morus notabilis]